MAFARYVGNIISLVYILTLGSPVFVDIYKTEGYSKTAKTRLHILFCFLGVIILFSISVLYL